MKLIFKVFLFAAVISLLYATTLTDPHTFVFWEAFVQSRAFFWSLIITLAVIGGLAIVRYHQILAIKRKQQQTDALLSEAQATADTQQETLAALKRQLEDSYRQKEVSLQADYDRLKEPYLSKIKELKSQNIALKESVTKLMQALKAKKSG